MSSCVTAKSGENVRLIDGSPLRRQLNIIADYFCDELSFRCSFYNIYIFIAIALDEIDIYLVVVNFSIKTFTSHVSYTAPWGGTTSTSANNVLCVCDAGDVSP